jgi:pimeloyl-ACP methyl ester carboxylesterase
MKKRYFLYSLPIVLLGIYFLGPTPAKPVFQAELPVVNQNLAELEAEINRSEKSHPSLKPDNQARIVWADSTKKQKTPYALVYLHGFSASQMEGDPVHCDFARRYGCNLYLSRLEGHGLDTAEIFLNLKPEALLASAQRAVAIGKALGDTVIIMATSNGGAMALKIASDHPEIKGLIIYSPLIDFYDKASAVLTQPWGLQIARQVQGSDYYLSTDSAASNRAFWNTKYRVEGLVALKEMIEVTMTKETFEKIKMPVFLGYYYKNEEEQDKVVSVPAMLKMFEELTTPASLKRKVAFPNAANHVIASRFRSKEVENVRQQTFRFAEEVLRVKPLE